MTEQLSLSSTHAICHVFWNGPYSFQDARRPQPALVQDVLWDMIPEVQDVILAHKHNELLIVRTEGLVAVDEPLYEPTRERVLLVSYFLTSCFITEFSATLV